MAQRQVNAGRSSPLRDRRTCILLTFTLVRPNPHEFSVSVRRAGARIFLGSPSVHRATLPLKVARSYTASLDMQGYR